MIGISAHPTSRSENVPWDSTSTLSEKSAISGKLMVTELFQNGVFAPLTHTWEHCRCCPTDSLTYGSMRPMP